MKKLVFVLVLVLGFYGASYFEHNYTRDECKVVDIIDGYARIEDKVGHYWDCDDEGLEIGDYVDLKMFDNYSSAYIGDDIVKKVIIK